MDDTCWDISDILYSDFCVSIVDIHIWEDWWVEVYESIFSLSDTRLYKNETYQKDTDDHYKKENHKRKISHHSLRRSMIHLIYHSWKKNPSPNYDSMMNYYLYNVNRFIQN